MVQDIEEVVETIVATLEQDLDTAPMVARMAWSALDAKKREKVRNYIKGLVKRVLEKKFGVATCEPKEEEH